MDRQAINHRLKEEDETRLTLHLLADHHQVPSIHQWMEVVIRGLQYRHGQQEHGMDRQAINHRLKEEDEIRLTLRLLADHHLAPSIHQWTEVTVIRGLQYRHGQQGHGMDRQAINHRLKEEDEIRLTLRLLAQEPGHHHQVPRTHWTVLAAILGPPIEVAVTRLMPS
jgi:hypothetical protein